MDVWDDNNEINIILEDNEVTIHHLRDKERTIVRMGVYMAQHLRNLITDNITCIDP